MVNPCCYGGPLCMMSVRDISFFIMFSCYVILLAYKKKKKRNCTRPLYNSFIINYILHYPEKDIYYHLLPPYFVAPHPLHFSPYTYSVYAGLSTTHTWVVSAS